MNTTVTLFMVEWKYSENHHNLSFKWEREMAITLLMTSFIINHADFWKFGGLKFLYIFCIFAGKKNLFWILKKKFYDLRYHNIEAQLCNSIMLPCWLNQSLSIWIMHGKKNTCFCAFYWLIQLFFYQTIFVGFIQSNKVVRKILFISGGTEAGKNDLEIFVSAALILRALFPVAAVTVSFIYLQ